MNYEKWDLTLSELYLFYGLMIIAGCIIGWLFYDSIPAGILVGIIFCTKKVELENYLITKRKRELLLQFKDFLYSLSSSVSTGRSIRQGIAESLEFWRETYNEDDYIIVELEDMINKMEKGNMQDIAVLDDFANRSGLRDVKDMVLACKICKKIGGNLSSALQQCSDIIGDKILLERELNAMMAQKKIEGRIIAVAPFLLLLLIRLASPQYLHPLLHTKTGRLVSTIALVIIAAAWVYIERVNDIEI